ncbi:MAG: 50S ribosomal protein L10 [Candidatus Omnitrophica bacterium]|nr:50S ribosomal protein L10 [Candidatus Omnitrophota bacterium]
MEKIGKIFRDSLVKNIKTNVQEKKSTFLLSYTAVSSKQMDSLRKNMKTKGAKVFVSKNRLAQIALKELEQENFANSITSQTAFIWSNEDAAAVSKSLVDFAKEIKGAVVQGGILDGAFLSKEQVQKLAALPPREVLLAQLLQTILSPITQLAGVLNAKSKDLLSILKQLSEKKGGKDG